MTCFTAGSWFQTGFCPVTKPANSLQNRQLNIATWNQVDRFQNGQLVLKRVKLQLHLGILSHLTP